MVDMRYYRECPLAANYYDEPRKEDLIRMMRSSCSNALLYTAIEGCGRKVIHSIDASQLDEDLDDDYTFESRNDLLIAAIVAQNDYEMMRL